MNSSTKRKRFLVDDSDEEPSLGKQVLPVAKLPNNFDGEPMDGLQYLFMVRRDAHSLPHVTRVHNPFEVKDEPQQPAFPVASSSSDIPMPSDQWREIFIKRFRNFRKNSMQCTTRIDRPSGTSQKRLPDKKDRDAWWAFLSGRPEIEWNPPKKPKAPTAKQQRQQRYGTGGGIRGFSDEWTAVDPTPEISYTDDPSFSLPTPSGTPAPGGEGPSSDRSAEMLAEVQAREPTPLLLRYIDHRYSLHLLMYFTHWINIYLEQPHPRHSHMREVHARWIFSLLSRVDDYVSADEMSLLRNLTRACMALLKETFLDDARRTAASLTLEEERMSERSCWLIIGIVVDHWAQRDLWTDLEGMLSEIKSE